MINQNPICVFDFETCNLRCDLTSPIQLAAVMLDPRSLEPIEGGEFCALMRAPDESAIEDDALRVNKKTREEIAAALEQKIVWNMFVSFLKKFQKDNTQWARPIPAGHNIINFDIPIIEVLSRAYGNVDKQNRSTIFDGRFKLDTMQLTWLWFEGLREPSRLNLDYLRDYFGISKEGAHDALKDCRDCAIIIKRFLQYHRAHAKRTSFKGAFLETANATA